jgi:hypothetical protein
VAEIEGGSEFFWSLRASFAVRVADCLAPSDLQGTVSGSPKPSSKQGAGSGAYGPACAFVVVFIFCVLLLLCYAASLFVSDQNLGCNSYFIAQIACPLLVLATDHAPVEEFFCCLGYL